MKEQTMKQQLLKSSVFGFGYLKSAHYAVQGLLLPVIDRVMNGKTERSFTRYQDHLKTAYPKLQNLLEKDFKNISSGVYPISVLETDFIINDYRRLPMILWDAIRAQKQKKQKKNSVFDHEAQRFLKNKPDYYQRNFHFQKNGYLSDDSAELYDQQVEVLFSGTAQLMRRQVVAPIHHYSQSKDTASMKILELGCGTGSLSKYLAMAFPNAQITCLDLSPHYLKMARQNLKKMTNINFIEGLAEATDFKDETFDVVVSCYMFHELPADVRQLVLQEKFRVLKNGGLMVSADSIQKGDDDEMNWALEQFPVDFHEPFYKNYVENPLEKVIGQVFGGDVKTDLHFLTKIVSVEKSTEVLK